MPSIGELTATSVTRWEAIPIIDAYDVLASPIMIADPDMIIRYVNEGAYRLFEAIEQEIKVDLPHFSARDIVGKSIDVFHKNPRYQRHIMDGLSKPHDGKFSIGGRDLAFRAAPKFGPNGNLVCICVEWQDRTAAISRRKQIETLISDLSDMTIAHDEGRILQFLDPSKFDQEYASLAANVNKMVQGHIETKKKIIRCAEAYAAGDFSYELERFTGDRKFLNEAMDAIRDNFLDVVREIKNLSLAIVDGRLDQKIDTSRFSGEFKQIIEAFREAFDSLNQSLHTVNQQIEQITAVVDDVAKSSRSLAASAQVGSASSEELSASAEQTEAQVRRNAEAAKDARELVIASVNVAQTGETKVQTMYETMANISQSSSDIAKIIKVIDEIAFQTNLLALNAAVEAARAGQHGRGFAVVAQEVRDLAARSAKAAKETSELIETSSARVAYGVQAVGETKAAFSEIAKNVHLAKERIDEIAVASSEQAQGVGQINMAIGEIAKVATETSTQADQLASASAEMLGASQAVKSALAKFTLTAQTKEVDGIVDALQRQLPPEVFQQLMALMTPKGPVKAPKIKLVHSNADRDQRGYSSF